MQVVNTSVSPLSNGLAVLLAFLRSAYQRAPEAADDQLMAFQQHLDS
jgi:hypothetical protein